MKGSPCHRKYDQIELVSGGKCVRCASVSGIAGEVGKREELSHINPVGIQGGF